MARRPIRASDGPIIELASSAEVIAVLGDYSAANPPWLPAAHPFPQGSLPPRFDFNGISQRQLTELIAVRGPLHCSDGWSYLSKAISALFLGDRHAARHLAYYAELRASLSILASQGIGIFNNINCVIDDAGNRHDLENRGTHEMCWLALDHWAKTPGSFEKIASAININGATLFEALSAYFPGSSGTTLGHGLIKGWGVDLSAATDDHIARNYSSYTPNDLSPMSGRPALDLDFIGSLWRSFQPSAFGLERHLLRLILETELANTGGATLSPLGYANLDPRIAAHVSEGFLSRTEEVDEHPIIRTADTTDTSAEAMLARGAILLRIATSLAQDNLGKAGVGINELEPWWSTLGLERGLWSHPAEPTDMSELWMEVEDALEAASRAEQTSRHGWLGELPGSTLRLFQTERIALWNLCA